MMAFCKCKTSKSIVSRHGESLELITTFDIFRTGRDSSALIMRQKVWCQDSIGVTEICAIRFERTDTTSVTSTPTLGYRYINLKEKLAYEYASFSDTATFKKKYRYSDTTTFVGGWNFNKSMNYPVDELQPLADTVINGIIYKRYKFKYREMQEGIYWVRCDKKDTFFQLVKSLADKVGCTPVFVGTFPTNTPKNIYSHELKFISNYLPDSVQKIFAAWKKNETKYPVDKNE